VTFEICTCGPFSPYPGDLCCPPPNPIHQAAVYLTPAISHVRTLWYCES